MATLKELMEKGEPRFKQDDRDIYYKLFDALLEIVFLKGKLPDMSKPVESGEDGALHFTASEYDFEPTVMKRVKGTASEDERNAVNCVMHWVRSLGISGKSTCGDYAKALGFEQTGPAFYWEKGKEGLWGIGQGAVAGKAPDLELLPLLLWQCCQPCIGAQTIDDVKKQLESTALKRGLNNKFSNASIRNGILHFANPNRYMHFYTVSDKIAFITKCCSDYEDRLKNAERVAANNGTPSYYKKGLYSAAYSDDILCEEFDKLRSRHLDMEYHDFMRQFVYVDKSSNKKK